MVTAPCKYYSTNVLGAAWGLGVGGLVGWLANPKHGISEVGDEFVVHMEGVDIYDPVANTIQATRASKVADWFLDADYDGQTFCISQAFFPDKSAWAKLAIALKTLVDPDRFAGFPAPPRFRSP